MIIFREQKKSFLPFMGLLFHISKKNWSIFIVKNNHYVTKIYVGLLQHSFDIRLF